MMEFLSTWNVLPAAFILDLIIGDPRWLPHPVRWMGTAIVVLVTGFSAYFASLSPEMRPLL